MYSRLSHLHSCCWSTKKIPPWVMYQQNNVKDTRSTCLYFHWFTYIHSSFDSFKYIFYIYMFLFTPMTLLSWWRSKFVSSLWWFCLNVQTFTLSDCFYVSFTSSFVLFFIIQRFIDAFYIFLFIYYYHLILII